MSEPVFSDRARRILVRLGNIAGVLGALASLGLIAYYATLALRLI